ncbi:hypothetical protein DSO57_1018755 [Entomophthora muscae]|uniref:Uncharacterized protein n=1 Tax=Entomophthora muscae TaxID=34485 RepID=A0ACC2RV98_9FUNG|nr:hypothetical protein DSO57_1018755 [Entomophthora muscae]
MGPKAKLQYAIAINLVSDPKFVPNIATEISSLDGVSKGLFTELVIPAFIHRQVEFVVLAVEGVLEQSACRKRCDSWDSNQFPYSRRINRVIPIPL